MNKKGKIDKKKINVFLNKTMSNLIYKERKYMPMLRKKAKRFLR